MKRFTQILKPPTDTNLYRVLHTPNNLKCLLISDKSTDICAASMNVSVGSLKDPKEFQGLAHFLEHMLFMGSEKFPDEAHYKRFISANGGSCNAYTSMFDTNYHFQIGKQGLGEALEIFSQFFKSPLLREDCVDREINAVNSEAVKNLNQDGRRFYQLSRHISNKESPFNKYSTGNLETLQKPGIRDALLEFHKKWYSADLMTLVVYSNQDLDEMESQIFELFADVPNKEISPLEYKNELKAFPEENCQKLIRYRPVNDKDTLKMVFYLPECSKTFRKKPLSYFSHLLGHECKNSILALLLKENLATSLSSSSNSKEDYFSTISITVTLTEKGYNNYEQVIASVLAYIAALQAKGLQSWVYEEKKQLAEISFQHMTQSSPLRTAIHLSEALGMYEPEEVVKNVYCYDEYDEELLKGFLKEFVKENCNIFLCSQKIPEEELKELEPIYNVQYSIETVSERVRELFGKRELKWKESDLKLGYPERNRFIPDRLEVFELPENAPKHPEKVIDDATGTFWHLQENTFKMPKLGFWISITSNSGNCWTDPRGSVLTGLWISMLKEVLRDFQYMLEMANSRFTVYRTSSGISLDIKCFDQVLEPILDGLAHHLKENQTFDEKEIFQNLLNKKIKNLRNDRKSPPYKLVNKFLSASIYHK